MTAISAGNFTDRASGYFGGLESLATTATPSGLHQNKIAHVAAFEGLYSEVWAWIGSNNVRNM